VSRGPEGLYYPQSENALALDEADMSSHTLVQPAVPRAVIDVLVVLTVAGIAGIVVTTMLGFEEPDTPMLLVSGAMMLAAPIGALLHLSVTRGITHDEKRIWLKEFRSARIGSALAEYLSSANLSESARRRAQDASKRQPSGRISN
jgi:hypothetical protein